MRRQTKRDSETAPEDLLIRQAQEGNPAALNMLGLLPSNERELLLLHYCGLAVPEIAKVLGSSDQSVQSQLSGARGRLQGLRQIALTGSTWNLEQERPVHVARVLQRYHELIDRRLSGTMSSGEEQALHTIEGMLQCIEDTEIPATVEGVELHHDMLMQQLRELTTELRKFRAGKQPQSEVQ
jgi:hypothetical protein